MKDCEGGAEDTVLIYPFLDRGRTHFQPTCSFVCHFFFVISRKRQEVIVRWKNTNASYSGEILTFVYIMKRLQGQMPHNTALPPPFEAGKERYQTYTYIQVTGCMSLTASWSINGWDHVTPCTQGLPPCLFWVSRLWGRGRIPPLRRGGSSGSHQVNGCLT